MDEKGTIVAIVAYNPYRVLDAEQRAEFQRRGESLGLFSGDPPNDWQCRVCGAQYSLKGSDKECLGVAEGSYFPVCHDGDCPGYGWHLIWPTDLIQSQMRNSI
jgi:hypothetical protein